MAESVSTDLESLETRIAHAADGADSTILVLAAATATEIDALLAGVRARLATRAIHGVVPAAAADVSGTMEALTRVLSTHAGAARILDPLVRAAAAFVLGRELSQHASALEPFALDAANATSLDGSVARLVQKRFVPAFAAQAPDVPLELIRALARARCGGPEDAPELIATARTLGAAAVVTGLAQLANRAGVALVLTFDGALEHPAASAARALETPRAAGVVLLLPAIRERWTLESVLLSDSERARLVTLASPILPPPFVPTSALARTSAGAAGTGSGQPGAGTLAADGSVLLPSTSRPAGTAADTPSGRLLSPRERVRAQRAGSGRAESAATPGDGNATLRSSTSGAFPAGLTLRPPSGILRAPGAGSARSPATRSSTIRRPSDEGSVAGYSSRRVPMPEGARRVSRVGVLTVAAVPIVALGAILALGRGDPEIERATRVAVVVAPPAPVAPAVAPSSGTASGPEAKHPVKPASRGSATAPVKPEASPASWTPSDPFAQAQTSAEVAAIVARDLPLCLSLESRTTLLERALPRLDAETRARVLLDAMDTPIGSPQDVHFLRRFAIERLAPLTGVSAASARFVTLLDFSAARDERLCALRSIALSPGHMTPELHDKLASLAAGREEGIVASQARSILEAIDAMPTPPSGPNATPGQ